KQDRPAVPGFYGANNHFERFFLVWIQFESATRDKPLVSVWIALCIFELHLQETTVNQLLDRAIRGRSAFFQLPPADWLANIGGKLQHSRLAGSLFLEGFADGFRNIGADGKGP